MLARARTLFGRGAFAGAAQAYESAFEASPASPEGRAALVSLGDLRLSELHDPRGALSAFDAYLAGGGVLAAEAEFGRIGALRALGRHDEEWAAARALSASASGWTSLRCTAPPPRKLDPPLWGEGADHLSSSPMNAAPLSPRKPRSRAASWPAWSPALLLASAPGCGPDTEDIVAVGVSIDASTHSDAPPGAVSCAASLGCRADFRGDRLCRSPCAAAGTCPSTASSAPTWSGSPPPPRKPLSASTAPSPTCSSCGQAATSSSRARHPPSSVACRPRATFASPPVATWRALSPSRGTLGSAPT